jgi:hypothetical protein
MSRWSLKPGADIAVAVTILVSSDATVDMQNVWLAQVGGTRRMDSKLSYKGQRRRNIELNVVT